MHERTLKVRDFHLAMGRPAPEAFTPLDESGMVLRAQLLLEEAIEFCTACGLDVHLHPDGTFWFERRDKPFRLGKVVDALCDVAYVQEGACVQMGLDLDPYFDEVHRSNMAKSGGEISPEGKVLKPRGWEPPQIDKLLRNKAGFFPEWRK